MKSNGDVLVEEVKLFMKKNNRLPQNEYEIDFDFSMETGPFYRKVNDSSYYVYFSIGFDEYFQYSSETNKWEYFP